MVRIRLRTDERVIESDTDLLEQEVSQVIDGKQIIGCSHIITIAFLQSQFQFEVAARDIHIIFLCLSWRSEWGPFDNSRYWHRSGELWTSPTWDSLHHRKRREGVNRSLSSFLASCLLELSSPNRSQVVLCVTTRSSLHFVLFSVDHSTANQSLSEVRDERFWKRWDSFSEDVVHFSFHQFVHLFKCFAFDGSLLPLLTPRMPPAMLGYSNGPTVVKPFHPSCALALIRSWTNPLPDWSSGLNRVKLPPLMFLWNVGWWSYFLHQISPDHVVCASCVSIMSNTCLLSGIYWMGRGSKYWTPSLLQRKLTSRSNSVTSFPTTELPATSEFANEFPPQLQTLGRHSWNASCRWYSESKDLDPPSKNTGLSFPFPSLCSPPRSCVIFSKSGTKSVKNSWRSLGPST